MTTEDKPRRLPVIQQLGGLHQDPWGGGIKDGDTSDERNIDHSVAGEWSPRSGMSYVGIVSSATPETSLHYHCDTALSTSAASACAVSGELASGGGNYVSSGISISADVYVPNSNTANGAYPGGNYADARFEFAAPGNVFQTSGAVQFYVRSIASSLTNPKWTTYPPDSEVGIFDAGGDLKVAVTTGGEVKAYLASSTVSITDSTTNFRMNTWHKINLQYNFLGLSTESEHTLYVDDLQVAQSTAAVDVPTLTSATFLNTTAYDAAPVTSNWGELNGKQFVIDDITAWGEGGEGEIFYPQKITGIWDNGSQDRLIIAAGNKVFQGTAFTEVIATAGSTATITADTRKSGTEWQGNFYMTTGDATAGEGIIKIIGDEDKWTDLANSPAGTKYLASYHNHIWAAGVTGALQSVRCSEFDTDNVWTTINADFKCKDDVTGIKPYGGQLIVGTKTTMEAISGYNRYDFAKTLVTDSVGCISHWSMQTATLNGNVQALLWAAMDGIWTMVGGQVYKVSQRVQAYWDTLTSSELNQSHAIINLSKGEYALCVTKSGADHDEMVVYNYLKDTFSVFSYDQKLDVVGEFNSSGSAFLYAGNASGRIYRIDTGAYDDFKEIGGEDGAFVYSKWFDMDIPDIEKDLRAIWALYEKSGDYSLEVGWENNWNESASTDTIANTELINLNPGGSVYGTAVYGTDIYSGSSNSTEITQVHMGDSEARARSIRYRFRNSPSDTGAKFVLRGFIQLWTPLEEYPA